MAISGERIYLIAYYHHFLRSGTIPPGKITTPLDPEGAWLRSGIIYAAGESKWVILAVKNATREGLISLIQQTHLSGSKVAGTVLLTLKVPEGLSEGAQKLGVALYQFSEEPKLPPIPCSTCGARLDPTKMPWRCPKCAPKFTGEYRLVICHRCALPFRSVPSLAHRLASQLEKEGVWKDEIICPDCRLAELPEPLLEFDGTLRGVILWALLRGHLKLENLIQLGASTSYVNEEIRPAFVTLLVSVRKKTPETAKSSPRAVVPLAKGTSGEGKVSADESDSVVALYSAVGGALGISDEVIAHRNTIDLEIDSIEQALRTGEKRRPDEDAVTYLARVRPRRSPADPIPIAPLLDAVESTVLEAYSQLHEADAEKFRKEEVNVVERLSKLTSIKEEGEESLLGYLLRLRVMLFQPAPPAAPQK